MLASGVILKVFNKQYSRGTKHLELLLAIKPDTDDTTFMAKWRGTKEPLDESEKKEWKSWLKAQHSEN